MLLILKGLIFKKVFLKELIHASKVVYFCFDNSLVVTAYVVLELIFLIECLYVEKLHMPFKWKLFFTVTEKLHLQ